MNNNESIDQARYIFSTEKMIRDHILKTQTAQLASCGKSGTLGDLSLPQFHTIMIVRAIGRVTITELSDRLGVSPPSASAMVDRLVEKGILNREHSTEDRRKVMVQISPNAIKGIEGVEETILRSFVEIVERIGPETTRKWCDVLDQVKSVLETY
jgi:DNA-binding MarR family transcriptional regulator